jgi:hypothetical protein
MTIDEFVAHEIAIWGFEEIESLYNRGYLVVLTNRGPRWVLTNAGVDTDRPRCYSENPTATRTPVRVSRG